jgi:glycerol-3-phosphate acyltransferase PlsY
MTPLLPALIATIAGYFLGAIPFAYLIVRARKGIDIRTVGSGNVGATNAGRILGFRYFLLIFGLDLLKGLFPTLLLPRLVEQLTGSPGPPTLPVFIALATILGHNFPVYLGFKGGKGVATSFGALLALDPVSSLSALATFVVVLLVTRFVSMSSILGAVAFAGVHFSRVERPWSRDELPMSLVTILLVVMLVVRHRTNLVRIARGTESKVMLGRTRNRRDHQPATNLSERKEQDEQSH